MNFFQRIFRTDTYKRQQLISEFVENSFFKNHSINVNTALGIYEMYHKNIVLRALVEKTAEIFSRVELQQLDAKGVKISKPTALQPFLSPLKLNSEQFLKLFAIQYTLYDTVILYHKDSMQGVFNEKSKLTILDFPLCNFYWKTNVSNDFSTTWKDNLNYITYSYNGKNYQFFPSELEIISKYEFKQDMTFTLSSANNDLNSIYKALVIRDKYNTNTQLGMITPSSSSKTGDYGQDISEISDEEKKLVQKELSEYSSFNGRYNLIVGKKAMQYIDLMPNIEKMLLDESTNSSILRLCSLLNFPATSLNMLTDAKYSNKEFGNKDVYTDLIIPLWNLFEVTINKLYNFKYDLQVDYSFVEALQSDKKIEFELSDLQADAVIKVNDNIQKGIITYDNGINILVNIYKVDSESVELYLNKNQNATNQTI
jgi:hypothetical protein